jgi:predicted AAA+ superfamily ATPase
MFSKLEKVAAKVEALIGKIDALLPVLPDNDWLSVAYRWQRIDVGAFGGARGVLRPVLQPHLIRLDDLHDIDEQKQRLLANTKQYVEGRTANNVLLTGARGTGKSSLVKAMLHRFSGHGLRLIEVDRADLIDLPAIAEMVAARPEKFIVFADDLSFEVGDPAYKALKSVLDGGVSAPTENMLVYATSNRRHLMPERLSENAEAVHTESDEIHPGETTEEKISLSERFGLWLSFYPFDQAQYLDIAHHWVVVLAGRAKFDEAVFRKEALLWALERGGRSGRIAYQFARDFAGQLVVQSKSINKPHRQLRVPRAAPAMVSLKRGSSPAKAKRARAKT